MAAHQTSADSKRGQVAAALWGVHYGASLLGELPPAPKPFTRRISRFIELGVPFSPDQRPGQPGVDLEFSAADGVELGIALDLQNAGLNQLEIARWALFYRESLRQGIAELLDKLKRESKPPVTYLMVGNRVFAESRGVFESRSPALWAGITIGAPKFVVGREKVLEEISQLGGRNRIRIIVEVETLVRGFITGLLKAPLRRRGRQ
jgi:hypothetical protein